MKKTLFLLGSFFCWFIGSHARQPNLVVFLTDDQGWGDLSISGNTNLDTSNIDSLAREGTTLQNFYVCAVCAPTRAEFLTGRYYPRTGVSGVSRGQERLNPDELTITEVFKANGYVTGAFGKWHNGTQPPYHPNYRGFDEFYGFTSGHWGHYFSPPLDHNGKKVRGNGYVVDDFTDRAIEFIEKNKEKPFFCYLPYNTPHSPMMISDEYYGKFAGKEPEMRYRDPKQEDVMMTRAALAMCENIDWNVGRVLNTLEELGLEDDTIVVYFSDNGPNSYRWNGGMKGRKGTLDEGGLRSPFFVRWPGRIPAGRSVVEVTGAIDLLPTLAGLGGNKFQPARQLDGRNIQALLEDEDVVWKPRSLFSVHRNKVSVRTERFRLDANGKLFDMEADRGQRKDVAKEHPELAADLRLQAEEHNRAMQREFQRYEDRPFPVGYGSSTTLPARDGTEHGSIQRSARPPNNSFFTNWMQVDDAITWDVDVVRTGEYEVTVFYTCAEGDQGAGIELSAGSGGRTEARVTEVYDPPLFDKSLERMAESHYFVKDFKPLSLGTLSLSKGRTILRLGATEIPGNEAIDVHSIELHRAVD